MNTEYTIDMLIQKILTDDKQYDLSKIITAYEFAAKAHEGQKRSSGQPYIIHPLAVAYILLEFGMDTDTICAAMLHDVVEDTPTTLEEVKKRFGQDVAMLVDGVTKLNQIPIFNKEQQVAENVRKMVLAMSQDIRVIIIKLADRLHNMRTLEFRPDIKQRNTAHETMNIYAPIAHRLGMRGIKEELEDLSFHYLDPFAYSEIEHILEIRKEERNAFITKIKEDISQKFKGQDFEQTPQISGRVKSIYSIYKKMFVNHKSIEQIYDKYAVRIIVSTVGECYNVLGLVHDMYRPIPNRFKDYISNPKANMYQSLHTTVLGKEGIPFEIQIRTWEMHATAEYGIAAHWKYKQGINRNDTKMEQRLSWIRQVIEAQQTSDDVEEIVRIIKNDLAPEDILVMTPKGDSISLPIGSTIIDYAYRIHTQIGHKLTAAKVDGKIVPLDYQLQTGEICEIITSSEPNKGPNRAWLSIAQTNEAKSKIRSWFKKECRDENIQTGKAELEKEFRHFRIRLPEEELENFLSEDMRRHNCHTMDDFYASIGYGGTILSKIMPRLKDKYLKLYQKEEEPENVPVIKPVRHQSSIILDKINDCAVKFAQCCNPLPGDEIVGFITRGHGISVHTVNCTNYISAVKRGSSEELARWMDVQWTDSVQTSIQTSIEVIAVDRVGLVFDITAILTEARIPILHSSSRNLKNGNALFEATITIAGKEQLNNLFEKLRHVKDVISVERAQA